MELRGDGGAKYTKRLGDILVYLEEDSHSIEDKVKENRLVGWSVEGIAGMLLGGGKALSRDGYE